ncbi:MAG TPA: hypothetical protein VGO31_01515, partial [Microbacteriaceae bacterium]|nr:hypothetical protein [Microbacteriaceae bacterium]
MSPLGKVLIVVGLLVAAFGVGPVSAQASTDSFSVTLPLNAATDALGSGAANLETSTSEDDYTFTLVSAHALELDSSNCPGGFWNAVHLTVVDSSNTVVASNNGCGVWRTSSLAAGTYTLEVTQQDGATGTYDLHAFVVPAPDASSVTLPLNTATDTLGSGQPNLETTASEDDYTFTLAASHALQFEASSCPGGSPWGSVHLNIVDSAGSSVGSGNTCGLWQSPSLSPGTYTVQVTQENHWTGSYQLHAFVVPPPDAFSVSLPMNTATDTLGSGQANFETSVSEDDYTFTLGASHQLELDSSMCPGGFWASVHLVLVDSSNATVASTDGCGLYRTPSLSAGSYTLKVTQRDHLTGTYLLHAFVVPAPDAFSVTLPLNTATDTLGSGQANLETTASEDAYTFTLASARAVNIDSSSCPSGALRWALVDASNATITSNGCGNHASATLSAGSYTVKVTPQDGATGSYVLQLSLVPLPPANDDFANAQTISGVSGSTSGTTVSATGQVGEPHGFTGTVWFSWRALANEDEVVTGTVGGNGAHTSVYTGSSIGGLTQVSAQNESSPGSGAQFAAKRGVTYFVQLQGASPSSGASALDWGPASSLPGGTLVAQGFDARGPGADPTRTHVSVGPVSVDVTSGNALLGIPGPSFPSPAGSLGLSIAWNSLPSQPAPSRPLETATGGGACPVGTFTNPADWLACHPLRDYATGARSAPGFGSGFTLNLGSGSAPMQLIDHSALAPEPAVSTSSGRPENGPSTDPALAQAMDFVEVVSGDGSSRMFTHKQGTNEWLPSDMSLQSSIAGPNQVVTGIDQTDGARLEKDPSPGSGAPTWTLVDPDGTTATFGPVGADGKSRVWSVQEQAKASTAASSLARLEYAYTAGSSGTLFPTAITEQPSGRSLVLDWNELDPTGCPSAILCVTGPDGQTWTYVGNASGGTGGQLVSVSDGTRQVLGLGWSSDELVSVKSADDLDPTNASPGYNSSHQINLAYNSSNRTSSVADSNLTKAGSAHTNTWTFAYTELDRTTGPNGCGAFSQTKAAHAQTSAYGAIAANSYRQGCRWWTHVVLNSGSAWDYVTDMNGQLMEKYVGFDHMNLYEHAPDGRLLWSEDANGQPTDYTYDSQTGNLLTVKAPDPDGSGP